MSAQQRAPVLIATAALAFALLLGACAGPTPPTPPPATINVAGSVLNRGGSPFSGAEVFLTDAAGMRGPVTSSVTGGFVFTDVASPYALSFVPPPVSDLAPVTWASLTTPNPKVVLEVTTDGGMAHDCPTMVGRLAGFVTPAVGATGTAEAYFVAPALDKAAVSFAVEERGPGATAYELVPSFNGASCSNGANGTLVYIERDPTGDIEALAVEDGVFVARDNTVSTHLDINTAPAGTGTLAGTVTFPPGVDEVEVAPVMKIGDAYAIMDGRTVAAVAPNFTLKVPVFAGVEYRVLVTKNLAGSNYRWAWSEVVTAPASSITVALGDVAQLLSPSGPLTDPSPTFTYSEAASTNLYSVLVVKDGAYSHIAMSDETAVTVPALPAPNQLTGDYLWAVVGITARDADASDDLLDGRMSVGLHHLNYPLNEPDLVRSGFVNSNFLEFSLP